MLQLVRSDLSQPLCGAMLLKYECHQEQRAGNALYQLRKLRTEPSWSWQGMVLRTCIPNIYQCQLDMTLQTVIHSFKRQAGQAQKGPIACVPQQHRGIVLVVAVGVALQSKLICTGRLHVEFQQQVALLRMSLHCWSPPCQAHCLVTSS